MLILNVADNKLGDEACAKLTHFLEHHLTGFKVHELRLHKNCRIKCVHCGKCKHKLGMSEHVAFCSNTRFSAQLVAIQFDAGPLNATDVNVIRSF